MKFTEYHKTTRLRPDRAVIKMDWIERTIQNPIKRQIQADGRIRCWSKIEEMDEKYLRVILLEDGETVHNAFFDRSFKELAE